MCIGDWSSSVRNVEKYSCNTECIGGYVTNVYIIYFVTGSDYWLLQVMWYSSLIRVLICHDSLCKIYYMSCNQVWFSYFREVVSNDKLNKLIYLL